MRLTGVNEMNYIVPEYYNYFKCKCGECRHSCCEGWPVRISMKEYYYLLGINCSEKLRTRLDCALKICSNPSNERYAEISVNWLGICMLHRDDGLCSIQTELGENSLPTICRRYPRSTKHLAGICQCSCSTSCEKAVELLLNLKEPLRFIEKDLSILPEFELNLSAEQFKCCQKSISIIQNRCLPLPKRFILLFQFLSGRNNSFGKPNNLLAAFQLLNKMDQFFKDSISICDYCEASQRYFGIEEKDKLSEDDLNNATEKYKSALAHLKAILPDWQIPFEQIIVNHMFYNNFPYTDKMENTSDAFLALTMTYSFLRFNLLGCLTDQANSITLVDYLAAMFRLIDHSDFKYLAVKLFRKEAYPVKECVAELLNI